MSNSRFRTSVMAVVMAAALALAWTPRSTAQGTGGAFPDPISSAQLDRLADLLGLDQASRSELGPLHEAYLQRMRELREGPIADWLKTHASSRQVLGSSRPREEIEQSVRARVQILGQIERAERELVDRLAVGLPPEQSARLERVRQLAARERGRGLLGPFGGGAIVELELRELVDKLELDDAVKAAVEAPLDDYERRLTKLIEGMAGRAVQQPLVMTDALAAAGVGRRGAGGTSHEQADASAEEARAQFLETARVRSEVDAPQREARAAIAKLSRDTLSRLARALPPESAERLTDAFVRKAYSQVAMNDRPAGPVLASAAKIAEGSEGAPATAEAIGALRLDWRARYDAVNGEMMDIVDAGRSSGDLMGFLEVGEGGEARRQREERLAALREKRQGINDSAVEQVKALLGPALAQRMGAGQGAGERRIGGIEAAGVMLLDGGGGMEVFEFDGGEGIAVTIGGEGLPGVGGAGPLSQPISDRELERLIESLGIDADIRAIVEVLHEDYAESFDRLRGEIADELGRVVPSPGQRAEGPAGGVAMPFIMPGPMDEKSIARQYAIFQRGIERLAEVDRNFFDTLDGLLAGSSAGGRVPDARSSRERAVLRQAGRGPGAMGGIMLGGPSGGRESDIDLLEVTGTLDDAQRRSIEPILVRYAEAALAAARQRYDTSIAAQKEIDLFHAKAMKVGKDGNMEVSIDSNSDGFEAFQRSQRRIAEVAAQAATINRAARDEVLAVLPEDARLPFQRTYARAAWPGVYRDQIDVGRRIEAAMALATIDEARHARLAELLAEHIEAYEALCDRMVAAEMAAGPQLAVPDPGAMRAIGERQNEMRKLRFERSERNAATLRALGAILTPEEAQAVGGVAMPEERRRPVFELAR